MLNPETFLVISKPSPNSILNQMILTLEFNFTLPQSRRYQLRKFPLNSILALEINSTLPQSKHKTLIFKYQNQPRSNQILLNQETVRVISNSSPTLEFSFTLPQSKRYQLRKFPLNSNLALEINSTLPHSKRKTSSTPARKNVKI